MRRYAGWILSALTVLTLMSMAAPDTRAQTGDFAVSPQDCVIDPISLPEPGEVGDLATPSPTPTPIVADEGTPADEAVVGAVTERIEQAIACQNAGDVLQMLANFTERWIDERFAGYDLVFYSRFQEAAQNPEPLPADQQIELLSIDQVLVQSDGSVVATVTTRAREQDHTSLVVLVEDSGDWLIDAGAIESITMYD